MSEPSADKIPAATDDAARDHAAHAQAQKRRSLALALSLGAFAVVVFVITLLRLREQVLARPL